MRKSWKTAQATESGRNGGRERDKEEAIRPAEGPQLGERVAGPNDDASRTDGSLYRETVKGRRCAFLRMSESTFLGRLDHVGTAAGVSVTSIYAPPAAMQGS